MSSRPYHLHNGQKGAALAVRLVTRASMNEITEFMDDGTVKIRLTAGNADDQANKALVQYLSQVLQVPAANIEIIAGHAGRDKLVTILDLDAATVQERLVRKLA